MLLLIVIMRFFVIFLINHNDSIFPQGQGQKFPAVILSRNTLSSLLWYAMNIYVLQVIE